MAPNLMGSGIRVTEEKTVKKTVTFELTGDAIRKLVMDAYPEYFLGTNAQVVVSTTVPGGGDWSGCILEFDNSQQKLYIVIKSEE